MSASVFCALDTQNIAQATEWAHQLQPHIDGIKLGMEFFYAHGPAGITTVRPENMPLFLDLKIHDIPNTARKALQAVAPLKADLITLHGAGGGDMLRACVDMARQLDHSPALLAVTVLTSLDQNDLKQIGVQDTPLDQARRLAQLAQSAGCNGIVCSSQELGTLRQECDPDFKLVVPGIRPAGAALGDQKRVMTPDEAQNLGADYLVIGRPITEAISPVEAAQNIKKSLK